MRARRPSSTAQLVAFGRALADVGLSHVPNFRDPTARTLLNLKRRRTFAKTVHAVQVGKRGAGPRMARTMADLMALRTSAIDTAVHDAVEGGATQLVILGAGYDGRAWRMPELAGVRVFEVDHPATQEDKRTRIPELPAAIGDVTFVPIDFAKESLDAVLERAGHDRSKPTCWIWEGVVMYLAREVMRATLADIAGRSAAGSTLIVNYHTLHRRFLARVMFRLVGEPQVSAWTPEQMAADLRAAGFTIREDTGMTDWNARFANGEADVARGAYMRIAVAAR